MNFDMTIYENLFSMSCNVCFVKSNFVDRVDITILWNGLCFNYLQYLIKSYFLIILWILPSFASCSSSLHHTFLHAHNFSNKTSNCKLAKAKAHYFKYYNLLHKLVVSVKNYNGSFQSTNTQKSYNFDLYWNLKK